ncbi:MAG: ABC transporter permease [Armatimonadota bacterium]|nr:ABC transporter permease [Armatimonadota bacterium]MDR7401448.1 ABC transporter permease [Armatimonadota bacterium]MDR7404705.1 ABC transporter permease [Armatimonadota bacterium]MDR7437216.1 ABC transporter permease [Armatimonadota bacterium]MDR7473016.1 ABC transporter permease [Armatimonadota bacterium]
MMVERGTVGTVEWKNGEASPRTRGPQVFRPGHVRSPAPVVRQVGVTPPWRLALRRLRRHRLAVTGAVVAGALTALALLAPWVAPAPPDRSRLPERWMPPGPGHPLGTDELGRDVLSRLLYAGRISLAVGYGVALLVAAAGTAVGALAAFHGGAVDAVLMRAVDVLLAIPTLPLYLILAALLPGGGPGQVVLILAAFGWPPVARLVRAQVLTVREETFVEAARASGASDGRVLMRHVLPHAAGPVAVAATLAAAHAILSESALSYLGLGIAPPTASWGNMLQRAQDALWTAPWLAVAPGCAIALAVLGLNLLGDGLRDALDPRWHR